MIITLADTTAGEVHAALMDARRRAGSPAMGMVLTLIVVTDEQRYETAIDAAGDAAQEHPSRVLALIGSPATGQARLDAEVCIGGEKGPGEQVILRLSGELAGHPDSVVVPLLLPDAPVVVWWPGTPPSVPHADPLGTMAQRRITDTAVLADPIGGLLARAAHYAPGDTDVAWTRLTPWRSILAAVLDAPYAAVHSASVEAEPGSPSAALLAAWLASRLGVPVTSATSAGPGITGVALHTDDGDITLTRPDGVLAALSVPGWPERSVALKRRQLSELIAEELRRLDPDDIYAATLRHLASAALAGAST